MLISRATCVLLFTAMGYADAAEWGKREMRSRLAKLNQIIPENYTIGESNIDTVLDEILACNNEQEIIDLAKQDGPEIERITRAARAALANKLPQDLNALHEFIQRDAELADAEAVAIEIQEIDDVDLSQKPAKAAYAKQNRENTRLVVSKLKEEQAKKAAYRSMVSDALYTSDVPILDPHDSYANIRYTEGRPFYAGVVIAKYGNAQGITDDMINELDAYMPGNTKECTRMLRFAWHAINGYIKARVDGFKDYDKV